MKHQKPASGVFDHAGHWVIPRTSQRRSIPGLGHDFDYSAVKGLKDLDNSPWMVRSFSSKPWIWKKPISFPWISTFFNVEIHRCGPWFLGAGFFQAKRVMIKTLLQEEHCKPHVPKWRLAWGRCCFYGLKRCKKVPQKWGYQLDQANLRIFNPWIWWFEDIMVDMSI